MAISDALPLEAARPASHSRPIGLMQQPTLSTISQPPRTHDAPYTKFQQNLTVRSYMLLTSE